MKNLWIWNVAIYAVHFTVMVIMYFIGKDFVTSLFVSFVVAIAFLYSFIDKRDTVLLLSLGIVNIAGAAILSVSLYGEFQVIVFTLLFVLIALLMSFLVAYMVRRRGNKESLFLLFVCALPLYVGVLSGAYCFYLEHQQKKK